MSQEGLVFFNRSLSSIAEWQRAIDGLGFPLTLASDRDLRAGSGHLPAWLDGREAGFECGLTDLDEVRQTYDTFDFGGPWSAAMAFYYGSLTGCVGAWLAIAAWASATDGVAFDPQSGVVLSARDAVSYARETLAALPEMERQFGRLEFGSAS